MTQHKPVQLTLTDSVARITLDRPDGKNPLGPQTLQEIRAAIATIRNTPEIQVVVFEGAGTVFSVGFDLSAMASMIDPSGRPSEQALRASANLGQGVIDDIRNLSVTTVASVHGCAIGGGFLIAAACDFRIVAEGTRFSIPELDIGLPLLWGGVPLLVQLLGPALAKDVILTCRKFGPEDLIHTGFIHSLVQESDRERTTSALVEVIRQKPPVALRLTQEQLIEATTGANPTGDTDTDRLLKSAMHPDFIPTAMRYIQKIQKK